MCKIDIHFNAKQYLDARHSTVVVIDVLRATSTIVTALHNGCKAMIPTASISEALSTAARLKNVLLAGERNTQKPAHFNLGNSPWEFRPEVLSGKTIVFTTTNGTKALRSIQNAREIIMASFLNLDAIVAYLNRQQNDVIFYCAGNDGAFSLEDTLCASLIMRKLRKLNVRRKLSDAAHWALHALDRLLPEDEDDLGPAIYELVRKGEHAKKMIRNNLETDIAFCTQLNVFSEIPVLTDDNIIAAKRMVHK